LGILGIDFNKTQTDGLILYMEEILKWNKRHNLVKADAGGIVIRHILDSLAAVPVLNGFCQHEHILDVGAGAGFPGIPLAVFLNDRRFTLCERSAVRSAFLRNVCLLLGLENVLVEESDIKRIRGCYDMVLFRAFSSIIDLLPSLRRLLAKSGVILAYKGRLERLILELQPLTEYFKHIEVKKLDVPFLQAERHVLITCMRYGTI
jgi:16S rRNA (guanine527-N7)-methyltransferase